MSESRSPRFTQWAAFLIFSTITMGSVVEIAKDDDENAQSPTTWSIFCSAITFAITLLVVGMHMHPVTSILIVGTKIEGVLCCILSIFWIATVSVVTDSDNGLAVDESGAVSNGNLYYFSWAGFVCSITLLVSYLRHVFNVDVAGTIRTRSARLTIWSAHLATSLVVMGASSNFYDNTCGGQDKPQPQCKRAVFGIVLGALATLSSVGIVGIKIATSKAPFLIESLLAVLLVISYAWGVAFITSQEGPGAPLGNIYYFTWGSFLSAFMILASCFEDYNAAASVSDSDPTNPQASSMPPPTMGENHVRMDSLEDNV